jgi:hypothetical protein
VRPNWEVPDANSPVALGPALKRHTRIEFFPGALKRSFPRMNAGAPTEEKAPAEAQGSQRREGAC